MFGLGCLDHGRFVLALRTPPPQPYLPPRTCSPPRKVEMHQPTQIRPIPARSTILARASVARELWSRGNVALSNTLLDGP